MKASSVLDRPNKICPRPYPTQVIRSARRLEMYVLSQPQNGENRKFVVSCAASARPNI